MGIFARIFGICRTRPPLNPGCWGFSYNKIEIDLKQAQELASKGGAFRLEGDGLPFRVLVLRGEDDRYYALKNKCTHFGRRIDTLPGQGQLMCCSVSKSTFEYSGQKVSGPAKGPLTSFPVIQLEGKLIIDLAPTG